MTGRLYYIVCDGCGVSSCTIRELKDTSDEARAAALVRGWRRVPKRSHIVGVTGGSPGADYCPECYGRPPTPSKAREGGTRIESHSLRRAA